MCGHAPPVVRRRVACESPSRSHRGGLGFESHQLHHDTLTRNTYLKNVCEYGCLVCVIHRDQSVAVSLRVQYAMAAEPGNPAVAELSDPMDPGVLRLLSEVCVQAGGRATVSVCGEMAADPAATAVLIGLGMGSLSVSAPGGRRGEAGGSLGRACGCGCG
jgi:hypothetical protein